MRWPSAVHGRSTACRGSSAGQGLFWLTVLIYLIVLIPVQRRMIAAADAARGSGALPPEYRGLSKRWAMWGGIATLLPLIVLYVMVTKP